MVWPGTGIFFPFLSILWPLMAAARRAPSAENASQLARTPLPFSKASSGVSSAEQSPHRSQTPRTNGTPAHMTRFIAVSHRDRSRAQVDAVDFRQPDIGTR